MSSVRSPNAGLPGGGSFDPQGAHPGPYDCLCSSLLDLSLQQGPRGSPYAASDLDSAAATLGLTAAGLLGCCSQQQHSSSLDPLQQLAALQQQQQLSQALAADPLSNLSNLLVAQQGLSARVQELLLLKQQLQQGAPQRPAPSSCGSGGGGGIHGTGPLGNPLYKVVSGPRTAT